MNANLIFKWLNDSRFRTDAAAVEEAVFLPVEVPAGDMSYPVTDTPALSQLGGRMVIELTNGHRLTIEGAFDGDALARLLKGLVS